MAFVDELNLELAAGRGGDGVIRWRREKFAPKGGPAGGNGGRGGDVYLESVPDMMRLAKYRHHRRLAAGNGQDGGSARQDGRAGQDLTIAIPAGSVVKNRQTGAIYDFPRTGMKIKLLRGGQGGRGNYTFRSSRRTTPRIATAGRPGENGIFDFELRLVADTGFIGLPNAGKSSLLNALTAAQAKVGAYPFTTLEPHLGMLDGLVLADIPGLIAGAARGKGLGTTFLRHVRRTKILAHCLSLESSDVERDYQTVRAELAAYGQGLQQKPEVIVLTKRDLIDSPRFRKIEGALRAYRRPMTSCSIFDPASIIRLSAFFRQQVENMNRQ